MQYNVLEYLEGTVQALPDKVAYANENTGISFMEVYNGAKAIGTFLSSKGIYKQPVVVFMNKCPEAVVAFFGVVYGGDFYVPIEEEMLPLPYPAYTGQSKPRLSVTGHPKSHGSFDFGGEVTYTTIWLGQALTIMPLDVSGKGHRYRPNIHNIYIRVYWDTQGAGQRATARL